MVATVKRNKNLLIPIVSYLPNVNLKMFEISTPFWAVLVRTVRGGESLFKNLEIGVSTKFLVTARIRGNVLLKMSFLHI